MFLLFLFSNSGIQNYVRVKFQQKGKELGNKSTKIMHKCLARLCSLQLRSFFCSDSWLWLPDLQALAQPSLSSDLGSLSGDNNSFSSCSSWFCSLCTPICAVSHRYPNVLNVPISDCRYKQFTGEQRLPLFLPDQGINWSCCPVVLQLLKSCDS